MHTQEDDIPPVRVVVWFQEDATNSRNRGQCTREKAIDIGSLSLRRGSENASTAFVFHHSHACTTELDEEIEAEG
jgi:hypothetical protein